MNREAREAPVNGAQAENTPEQGVAPGPEYADIVIFCHSRNVGNLVQMFEMQIKHAAREFPMFVLWSGVSGVLHQGVIVLEWEGKVTPAFLNSLSLDHEIFDYVVYDWTRADESQESSSEQAETAQEGEKGTPGRQLV